MRPCAQCRADIADDARFCPFCGASANGGTPVPQDPYLGTVVNGKFHVEALIGQGGMGKVYRARHLTLERPVVLKILHRGFSADPAVAQRFHREAKAASRLNHPNSIAVLDFGQAEDGTLFMAMEYLQGKDLARVIAEGHPLPVGRIVRIGAQILSALAEAHALGIIHRDLKPENVMIEPRRNQPDHVKVLDFGIAKITESGAGETRLTQAGLVCGTPEYMSPEQASGKELDARSDLYSVGVILYQMATGLLPFESDTPVGFLTKHLSEPPPPPSRRRPGVAVAPALEALIMRALAKDPAARYGSADEMKEALLACDRAGGEALGGRPGSSAAAVAVPPPRRRGRTLAVAAVVVVIGGGAGVFLATRQTASAPHSGLPASGEGRNVPPPAPQSPPATPPTTPNPTTPTTPNATTPSTPNATQAATEKGTTRIAARTRRPDRARALELYERAEAKRADQDPGGAIKLYLAAEAADPSLVQVHKKLGLCYQMKGDNKRAAERYRRYLASNPEDADKVRAILATLR
jgi:serine/threonine-protein kinase